MSQFTESIKSLEEDKRFYLASSIFMESVKAQLFYPEARTMNKEIVGKARYRMWASASVACADALLEELSKKSNEE